MANGGSYHVDGAMLRQCEWIVRSYARYALIRCAGFTNSRRRAERIGVYTLITTCLLTREIEHPVPLGLLVDTMADIIGRDVARARKKTSARPRGAGGLLLAEERLRTLAEALNRLDRWAREVLVFHHVERMDAVTVAALLRKSRAEVSVEIARAEELLAGRLGELPPRGDPDVPSLLAELAVSLDADGVREMGDCALAYLARDIAADAPPPDRTDRN